MGRNSAKTAVTLGHRVSDTGYTRRPGEPDRAFEAFKVYAGKAGLNVSRTVELTGIPRRTIYAWRSAWGWKLRTLDPVGALEQLEQAPAQLAPPPSSPQPVTDLDQARDRVRQTLYSAAAIAAETLIGLTEGRLDGGDFSVMGSPMVKPAVRLTAATKLLELCGLNPPARVRLEQPPDGSFQSLAAVAERLTTSELRVLVAGFDRVEQGVGEQKASELPVLTEKSGVFVTETPAEGSDAPEAE